MPERGVILDSQGRGTQFKLDEYPIFTSDSRYDKDKDGLDDRWENIAVQSLRPTLLFHKNEDMFSDLHSASDHKVALFTRVTPVEMLTENGESLTYISFLNTALFTKDYGTPKAHVGGHNGDVASLHSAWKVSDDNSTIELERVWTNGHVGWKRSHEQSVTGVNGSASSNDWLGETEKYPLEFSSDGSLNIYIEEDKHSSWTSSSDHRDSGGSYPIASDIAIRPSAYNVGEPWFHPSPYFTNGIGGLFKGERIWNDPDGRFCGGLSCDNAKRGETVGSIAGAVIGSLVSFVASPGAGYLVGSAIKDLAIEIDGKSPGWLNERFSDKLIDGLFSGNSAKGGDFYKSNSGEVRKYSAFALSIDRIMTLDGDGLDGGSVKGRGDLYAKVNIEGSQERNTSVIRETTRGVGIYPNWKFYRNSTDSSIDIKIELWDEDGFGKGGGDDQADINPLYREKTLNLRYIIPDGSLYYSGTQGNGHSNGGTKKLPYADGKFYFEGEPGTDQTGIWLTLNTPDLHQLTNKALFLNNLTDTMQPGNKLSENIEIKQYKPKFGFFSRYERIKISNNSDLKTYRASDIETIQRFFGDGHDKIYLEGVSKSTYLGGGNGNDRIVFRSTPVGQTASSYLDGGAGNDFIEAGSGDDHLQGGEGADTLYAGYGDDYAIGDSGNDRIYGEQGDDILSGDHSVYSSGNDYLSGGDGDDAIAGGGGQDKLYGNDGDDVLLGDSFFDTISSITPANSSTNANDILNGGAGDDIILGEWGNDTVHGDLGNDELYGGVGNDNLFGGDGDDELYGNDGDDTLSGGAGNDLLDGGEGTDRISYADSSTRIIVDMSQNLVTSDSEGSDRIFNIDNVIASNFNDKIIGDTAANVLYGGHGNDYISGRIGDDKLLGESGNDELHGNRGNDVVDGGLGDDILKGGMGDDLLIGDEGQDRLTGGMGQDQLFGGLGNDILIGEDGNDRLVGESGNDELRGDQGNDELDGGIGDDILKGDIGDDLLIGGEGQDQLFGGLDQDQLFGGFGNDELRANRGNDVVDGGIGDDILKGGMGDDLLIGGKGQDRLTGGMGQDQLFGGLGNDILIGEDGDDWLDGGAGDDIFEGGRGADTFVLRTNNGNDTIQDFNITQDLFGLTDTLSFGQLSIEKMTQRSLEINALGQTLAVVNHVNANAFLEAGESIFFTV
ncbi:MAG: hypothetical protein AAGG51_03205 [Cyanobacteria bacterium P01_G01_bin.54]